MWNEFMVVCSWLSEIGLQERGSIWIDSFGFIGQQFRVVHFLFHFTYCVVVRRSLFYIPLIYSKSNILLNLTLNCDYIQDCLLNQTVVCNRISCINFPFFSILIFVFIDCFFRQFTNRTLFFSSFRWYRILGMKTRMKIVSLNRRQIIDCYLCPNIKSTHGDTLRYRIGAWFCEHKIVFFCRCRRRSFQPLTFQQWIMCHFFLLTKYLM